MNLSGQLRKLLKNFKNITVREESAVEILKRNDIDSELVLDPTLLLEKKKWEQITEGSKEKKEYILVYQLHNNRNFEKYCKELSKKVKLPIVRVSTSINQIFRCGKFKYLPTPGKFLNYIKNAKYIITDSFHGTVFSIIFNKEFISITPGNTETRIKSILELVGLNNRFLKNYNDFSLINSKIDWKKVNEKIDIERERCTKIFKESIFEKKEIVSVEDMNKSECTGCRACEQLCPKNAITMVKNKEGFIEPKVNKDKCINCGLCANRCPQLNYKNISDNQKVYAVKLKDEKELLESSSGGAFVAIAKEILKRNGVVFGCAFSEELIPEHICIDNEEDIKKLKGSKYVQSNTKHTYEEVKKFLEKKVDVLYSGTPCQIGGLKAYLGKDYDNLITVELVCHGVPSPKLFKKYKEWLEDKYKAKLVSYEFRNKEKKIWGMNSKMTFSKNGKEKIIYKRGLLDPFCRSFSKAYTFRECCYKCKYAKVDRISDFTIGDYWGIEKEHPDFYDERGVSLLITNNKKSDKFFENYLKKKINYKESNIEKASKRNRNLYMPTIKPNQRKYAYVGIDNMDFMQYAKKSLAHSREIRYRIVNKIPKKVKKTIKKLLKK